MMNGVVIRGAEDLGDGNCEAGTKEMEERCAVGGLHSILSFFLSSTGIS